MDILVSGVRDNPFWNTKWHSKLMPFVIKQIGRPLKLCLGYKLFLLVLTNPMNFKLFLQNDIGCWRTKLQEALGV